MLDFDPHILTMLFGGGGAAAGGFFTFLATRKTTLDKREARLWDAMEKNHKECLDEKAKCEELTKANEGRIAELERRSRLAGGHMIVGP